MVGFSKVATMVRRRRQKRQLRDPEEEHSKDLADCSSSNYCTGAIPMSKSHLHLHKKAKSATSSNDIGHMKTSSTSSSYWPKGLHHPLLTSGGDSLVHRSLAKFIITNNIESDAVKEPSFLDFVRGVAECGPDYKPPTPLILQREYFPEVQMEVETYVRNVRQSWEITGCTILLDLWKNFINIIAYSPKGRVFLKLHEILIWKKSKPFLKDIISSVIEDIGVDRVVQVQLITSEDINFDSVKDMLLNKFPQIYQFPCPGHEIYSLIKAIYDEVKWVHETIGDGIFIAKFIYEEGINLSLMRQYTNKKGLKQPCMSKFSFQYHMLQLIFYYRNELQNLVSSQKWSLLDYSHNWKEKISSTIQNASFWSQIQEVLDVMDPLIQVLHLIEDAGSTAGYLYEAMIKAREAIERHCIIDQRKYAKILELFEKRRSNNIIHPIHAAAAFLNPAYMCNRDFKLDAEMKVGIDFVLETLVRNEEKGKFVEEVQLYRAKVSKVFNEMAFQMLDVAHPITWWNYCGDYLPILKKYAIRILSQPCQCSCDLKLSAFQVAQTKMMNGYDARTKAREDLVCTTMNAKIMENCRSFEANFLEPIDLENWHGTDFLHLDYKKKDMQEFFPCVTNIPRSKAQRRWTKLRSVVKWFCVYLQIHWKRSGNMEFYDLRSNLRGKFTSLTGSVEDFFNGIDYTLKDMRVYFPNLTVPSSSLDILRSKARRRWTKIYSVVKWLHVYLQIQGRRLGKMEFYNLNSNLREWNFKYFTGFDEGFFNGIDSTVQTSQLSFPFEPFVGEAYYGSSGGTLLDIFSDTNSMVQPPQACFGSHLATALTKVCKRWFKISCVLKFFFIYIKVKRRFHRMDIMGLRPQASIAGYKYPSPVNKTGRKWIKVLAMVKWLSIYIQVRRRGKGQMHM